VNRLLIGILTLALVTAVAVAQSPDDLNLQIHGFAAQAFVYSNANNYLAMNTSGGNSDWTEAAVNINAQVSDRLRVGAQLHYTRLGAFGAEEPTVDWALGDLNINQWMGLRAGKVKIRWGLYNDIQDYDPGYLWSLLPEGLYAIDIRSTNLAQLGAELYGQVPLKWKLGSLQYSAYYGSYRYVSDEGEMEQFKEAGMNFANPPGGKTPGFDLRWATPLKGLEVGGSLMMFDGKGDLVNGTYNQPLAFWPTYYASYEQRRFFLSYQYTKLVEYQTVAITGSAPQTSDSAYWSWFAMAGYHFTNKLQAGVYYNRYLLFSGGNNSDPANYFRDWVASGRYEINSNCYAKLEGHFIDGNGLGFYEFNNPDGLRPETRLLVGKIGFVF
jgi:hypothetical protein